MTIKRRFAEAMIGFAVVYTVLAVVGFFAVCTYNIMTPGCSGSGFSSPDCSVDPLQSRLIDLFFLWGFIGGCAAWFGAVVACQAADS